MAEPVFLTQKEAVAEIKTLFQQAKQIKCAVAFWSENLLITSELQVTCLECEKC